MVSILCLTYNHKKFIKQAVNSFLMQKTDFDFEILIHDDASTDGTVDILKEYKAKYPEKVRIVLSKKNKYRQGERGLFFKYLIPLARGKFIATCEGDDYFTNKNKIQYQVDYMRENPGCTVCFHSTLFRYDSSEEGAYIHPDRSIVDIHSQKDLLTRNFMHTSSVLYRKINYNRLTKKNVFLADWYLHLYHALQGEIGFIDKTMSVYRKHENGVYWDANEDLESLLLKNQRDHYYMFASLLDLCEDNSEEEAILISNIGRILNLKQRKESWLEIAKKDEIIKQLQDELAKEKTKQKEESAEASGYQEGAPRKHSLIKTLRQIFLKH